MTSPSSSNLPYIQLLTCVSINKTFEADFPVGAMLFNEISCPPGWNVSLTVSGRFPVALPVNGLPGATFGGPSLPYQDQRCFFLLFILLFIYFIFINFLNYFHNH